MPSSAGSTRSKKSARSTYRKVADTAQVDESLFGTNKTYGKPVQPGATSLVAKKELDTVKKQPDAVVISTSHFKTLKDKAKPVDQIEAARREELLRKQQAMDAAKERKEKIMNIDKIRKANGDTRKSELELEREEQDAKLLESAVTIIDERIDEVKHMNSLAHYARCVTIRDKQLEDRKVFEGMKKVDEKKQDEMMEIERIKAIKMYEEREHRRVEDRKKGAQIILEQMQDRERERLRQLELKEQEQSAMLAHIERMKKEDLKEAQERKEATRRLMEEVAIANAEQIRLKRMQRKAEKEEDMRIAEYLAEKERKEQEYQDELARMKSEKEREIARLRALQEKAQDKRSELDALRAKRAQEQYERDWRKRVREEAEKKRLMNLELERARKEQQREKELTMLEQVKEEREAFERIIDHQKKEQEFERLRADEEKRRRLGNAQELKSQIENTIELQERNRRESIEEGIRLKKQRELELKKIEIIRQKKLQELERQGIPSVYRVDLTKKDFATDPLRPADALGLKDSKGSKK